MTTINYIDHLKGIIDRVATGKEADSSELHSALLSGQIALAQGPGSVAAGGNITQSIIITGDFVYEGADPEAVRQLLRQELAKIAEDAHQQSLLDYFRALRHHCTNLPYLTLATMPGSFHKTLGEVYVPSRARCVNAEHSEGAEFTIDELLRFDPNNADRIHVLLLGKGGMGKSAAMRRVALRAWDDPPAVSLDRPHLPMVLRLQSLAAAEGATLDIRLLNALHQACELILKFHPPDDYFSRWSQIMNAPWLLLLDGLDEVPLTQRLSLLNWLNDLITTIKAERHRVVISSRQITDLGSLTQGQFAIFELQSFLPAQKQEFASRWFGEQAEAFTREIESLEDGEMPGTPLLLTIAASVYSHDHSLPDKSAKLYERYIDIWLSEAEERGLKAELGMELMEIMLPMLEDLALSMTENPEATSKQALIPPVAKLIRQALGGSDLLANARAKNFLEVMGRRSGVFNLRDEIAEWGHPNFREYLAARALERQRDGAWNNFAFLIAGKLFSDRWAEVLGKLAQITGAPVELIKQFCVESVQGENEESVSLIREYWQMSSARDDAEARSAVVEMVLSSFRFTHSFRRDDSKEFLVELGPQILDQLLATLSSPDAMLRRIVADILGRIGDLRAIDPLIRLLGDEDRSVSSAAHEAIGRIGEPAIGPLLVIIGDMSKPVDERVRCLWALNYVGIRNHEISQILESCLKEGLAGEPKILRASLLTSASLRDAQQTSYAQAALLSDDDESVQGAAKLLTQMPTESALSELSATFHRWSAPQEGVPDIFLLSQILTAIGRINTSESKEAVSQIVRENFDLIMTLMPGTAVWSPDETGVPEAHSLLLEDLTKRLSRDTSDNVIWYSLSRLGKLWQPDHLATLADTSDHLLARGIDLGQLMADSIVQGEQSKTQHPLYDTSMQICGLKLLAKCRTPKFAVSISNLLDLNNRLLDTTISDLLWLAGDVAAEGALLEKMEQPLSGADPAWACQHPLIRALGTCGTAKGAETILRHLYHAPELEANTAREAVVPLVLRGFVLPEQLAELALDTQASVVGQIVSVETLGYLRIKSCSEPLRALISQTKDERLLIKAAWAIYKVQDTSAITDLEALLLETESTNVASSVAYSLHRLEARQSLPALRKALEKFGPAGNTHLLTTLAWFQDPFVIPALKEVTREMRNQYAPPFAAIESVGRFLPEDWAREILLKQLETWYGASFDNGAQLYSVRALARSEPNLLLERVITLYDADHFYKSACQEVIGWLPELSSKDSVNQELLLEVLERLICDRSLTIREQAGEILGSLPLVLCRQLYTKLRHSADEWAQGCGVFSLGYFDDHESEISSSRFAERSTVRYFADVALQTYRRRQALKSLITQYQSSDGIARLAAYLSIGERGDEGTISALYDAIPENEMARIFMRQLGEKIDQRLSNDRRKQEEEEKERLRSRGSIRFD